MIATVTYGAWDRGKEDRAVPRRTPVCTANAYVLHRASAPHIMAGTTPAQVNRGSYSMNGNLKRIRESLALSRRELATRSEVNESTIYRAEHGMTALRPSTIQKLAKVLNVSPTEITKTEDEANN